MVGKTKTLTVAISGEDRGIGKPFDKTVDEAGKLQSKLKDAGEKAGKGLTGGVEGETDKLGAKLRNFGEKASEDINSGFKSGAGKIGSTLESAGSSAGDLFASGFDPSAVVDVLASGLGSSSGKLGTAAAGLGIAAGGAFAFGLINNMDIDAANDKLSAQLGLSAQQSEAFGNAAGELYANAYGDSIEQVNDALSAVHSSLGDFVGDSEDALIRATAKALDFATAFEVDVTEAAGVAGFAIRHGLARDSDHAWDLMVTAMQRMPASMREELFPAIEEYGSFLANLGFTGEQAFGLLAAASLEGSFGIDKTADALKELTIRATDMSTLSVASFEAAGLNADEMAARFLAGGDSARGALDDLIAGLLAIEDPVARSNAAIGLFGTPLEDLSVTEIPAFLEGLSSMSTDMGDVAGAADRMGDVLNDNAKVKIEAFRRQAMMKLTDFVANEVLPRLEALSNWAQDNPGKFQLLAGVIGGVLVLAFMAWAIAATSAAVATFAATWPVLAIVAALALLAAGIIYAYTHWGWFRTAVDAVANVLTNWVWPALQRVWSIIVNNVIPAIGNVIGWWWNLHATVFSVVAGVVGRILDIGGAVVGAWHLAQSVTASVWGWIEDKVSGVLDWISDRIANVKSVLNSLKSVGGGGGAFTVPGAGLVSGIISKAFPHGGVVPGHGAVPILAHGGELVMNSGQQANTLMAIAEGAPLDSGSRGGGGDTHIHVTVNVEGNIHSTRDVIDAINDGLATGYRLRDRGRAM